MSKFGGSRKREIPVFTAADTYEPTAAHDFFGDFLYVITAPGELQGRPAHLRWKSKKGGPKERFTSADVGYISVPDLYWMYRLFSLGNEKYQQDEHGEIPNLRRSLELLRDIHALLLSKPDKRQLEQYKLQIQQEVTAIIAYLNPNAHDARKQKAMEQAIAVALLKDSKDRYNPGAFAARIVTAIESILAREKAAVTIDAIFARHRRVVQSALCILEFEVDSQYIFLQKVLSDWDNLVANFKRPLMSRLVRQADGLSAYDVNPFRETFGYVAEEMAIAAEYLQADQYDLARTLLETAKNSLWLRKIRVELEHAMYAMSRKHRFPVTPFNKPMVLRAISSNADEIEKLDTTHMHAFDQKLVVAGLRGVVAALELPDWPLAHDRFEQVIVRI
jgi:hypothetical protein